jgi:hypothetical protein
MRESPIYCSNDYVAFTVTYIIVGRYMPYSIH